MKYYIERQSAPHYKWLKRILIWGLLFGTSCAGLTWRLFLVDFFSETDSIYKLLQDGIRKNVIFFIGALIPINFLGTIHYGAKKFKINSASGLLYLSSCMFLLAHFCFSEIGVNINSTIQWCLLLFMIILLSTGPIDTDRQWYLQLICISLEAVLFIKLQQEELVLSSIYFALAEVVFILGSFWTNRKHITILDGLKIISFPVYSVVISTLLLFLYSRNLVIQIYEIWVGAEENTLTWYSAANAMEPRLSAYMHIAMTSLHLIGLYIILHIAKRLSERALFVAQIIAAFDLATILYGIAIWYNLIPVSLSALMPFSSSASTIMIALVCNSYIYEDHVATKEAIEKNTFLKTILDLLNPFDDDDK